MYDKKKYEKMKMITRTVNLVGFIMVISFCGVLFSLISFLPPLPASGEPKRDLLQYIATKGNPKFYLYIAIVSLIVFLLSFITWIFIKNRYKDFII